jgi:molecular chaperone GrpE
MSDQLADEAPDTGAEPEHDAAPAPDARPSGDDAEAAGEDRVETVPPTDPVVDSRDDEQPDWEVVAAEDPRSRAELLAELTAAETDRDAYLDDLRRARAEFENYRKRTLRDQAGMKAAGTADLAARLLEVLDDFDRTLDAAAQSPDEGLAKGVTLVHGKLAEVLRSTGLTRIDEAGVAFDPSRHEAVQQVAAEEPVDQPVVAQVLRPGYELGGRVLRAAMVSVAQ